MGKKADALKTRLDTVEQGLFRHRKEINELKRFVETTVEAFNTGKLDIEPEPTARVYEEPIPARATVFMGDEYSDVSPEIKRAAYNLAVNTDLNIRAETLDSNAPRKAINDTKGRMLSLMATRLDCEIHVSEIREFFEEIYDLDADDVLDAMLYAQAMIMGEG